MTGSNSMSFLVSDPNFEDLPCAKNDFGALTKKARQAASPENMEMEHAHSARVRILRAERDLSQAELADALGVSRQTLNAIETGKYNPACRSPSRLRSCSNARSNLSFSRTSNRPDMPT